MEIFQFDFFLTHLTPFIVIIDEQLKVTQSRFVVDEKSQKPHQESFPRHDGNVLRSEKYFLTNDNDQRALSATHGKATN